MSHSLHGTKKVLFYVEIIHSISRKINVRRRQVIINTVTLEITKTRHFPEAVILKQGWRVAPSAVVKSEY